MAASTSKWLTAMALSAALSTTCAAIAHITSNYVLARCEVAYGLTVGTDAPGTQIDPIYDAGSYINRYQSEPNSPLSKAFTDQSKLTVKNLVAPKHGKLIWNPNTGPNISAQKESWYYYVSNKGYSGEDTFVMQVEAHGLKIEIHYTIEVPASDENPNGLCPLDEWKISQIDVKDATGNTLASTTFTPEAPFLPASPSTNLADVGLISPNIHVGIGTLGGSVVGEEKGVS